MRIILAGSDDDAHKREMDKTGFWGKYGAGCLFLCPKTKRLCWAHRSLYVNEPGTWGTWGGAIDDKEIPAEAVLREIKEETGFNGKVKLMELPVFKHSSGFHYFNYLAVVAKEFRPKVDWENQGFRWVDYKKVPTPTHDGAKWLVTKPEFRMIVEQAIGEG